MKRKSIVLIMILAILVSPRLFSQEKSSTEEQKTAIDYKIGPKDLLEISVFGHSDLSTRVRVSEEGKITFPLIGEVEVEGLTKTEVENKLSQLLEEGYLQNPQVTIFILEYQSRRVSVIGAVNSPGRYELLGRQTLLEIIAKAQGFSSDAGDEIIITRENNHGKRETLKISIEDLTIKEDANVDIPLQPNDVVYIPPDKILFIYVTGQVNRPGAIEVKRSLLPHFTLLRAIAQAGGFAERASKGGVIIKRIGEDGKERVIKVNVKDIIKGKNKDILLKENDVIYVPETLF